MLLKGEAGDWIRTKAPVIILESVSVSLRFHGCFGYFKSLAFMYEIYNYCQFLPKQQQQEKALRLGL
jgi:hypothetical protein